MTRWLTSRPTTPTVLPLKSPMLLIGECGGTRIVTARLMSWTTARACAISSASPRINARSAWPAENASAASIGVVFSTMVMRTCEPVVASRLPIADISLTTSASSEPIASLSVTGFEACRRPYRLKAITTDSSSVNNTSRSHRGSENDIVSSRPECPLQCSERNCCAAPSATLQSFNHARLPPGDKLARPAIVPIAARNPMDGLHRTGTTKRQPCQSCDERSSPGRCGAAVRRSGTSRRCSRRRPGARC